MGMGGCDRRGTPRLLDTNIFSDLVRNPQGRVTEHIREVGDARVCTSIIVVAELRYGAGKRESPRLTAQLEAVLDALEALPFEAPSRHHLRGDSKPT